MIMCVYVCGLCTIEQHGEVDELSGDEESLGAHDRATKGVYVEVVHRISVPVRVDASSSKHVSTLSPISLLSLFFVWVGDYFCDEYDDYDVYCCYP